MPNAHTITNNGTNTLVSMPSRNKQNGCISRLYPRLSGIPRLPSACLSLVQSRAGGLLKKLIPRPCFFAHESVVATGSSRIDFNDQPVHSISFNLMSHDPNEQLKRQKAFCQTASELLNNIEKFKSSRNHDVIESFKIFIDDHIAFINSKSSETITAQKNLSEIEADPQEYALLINAFGLFKDSFFNFLDKEASSSRSRRDKLHQVIGNLHNLDSPKENNNHVKVGIETGPFCAEYLTISEIQAEQRQQAGHSIEPSDALKDKPLWENLDKSLNNLKELKAKLANLDLKYKTGKIKNEIQILQNSVLDKIIYLAAEHHEVFTLAPEDTINELNAMIDTINQNISLLEKGVEIQSLHAGLSLSMSSKELRGKINDTQVSFESPQKFIMELSVFKKEMSSFCKKTKKLEEKTAKKIVDRRDLFLGHAPIDSAKGRLRQVFFQNRDTLKNDQRELADLEKKFQNVNLDDIKEAIQNQSSQVQIAENVKRALFLMRDISRIENDFSLINAYSKLTHEVNQNIHKIKIRDFFKKQHPEHWQTTRAADACTSSVPLLGNLVRWLASMGRHFKGFFGTQFAANIYADWQMPKWHLPDTEFSEWGEKLPHPTAGMSQELAIFLSEKIVQAKRLDEALYRLQNQPLSRGGEHDTKIREDRKNYMAALCRLLNDGDGIQSQNDDNDIVPLDLVRSDDKLKKRSKEMLNSARGADRSLNPLEVEDYRRNPSVCFSRIQDYRGHAKKVTEHPFQFAQQPVDQVSYEKYKAREVGRNFLNILEGNLHYGEGVLHNPLQSRADLAQNEGIRHIKTVDDYKGLFGLGAYLALFVPVFGNMVLKYAEIMGDHKVFYDHGNLDVTVQGNEDTRFLGFKPEQPCDPQPTPDTEQSSDVSLNTSANIGLLSRNGGRANGNGIGTGRVNGNGKGAGQANGPGNNGRYA